MSRLTLLEKILELEEELESLPPYDEELNQLCESQDQIQKEIYSLINRLSSTSSTCFFSITF